MGKKASRAAKPASKTTARARKSRDYHLPPGVARQSLLQSAIRLLNERGMGNVSLNDVAREAKLNPALVTYYFGSKENLFQAVVEQVIGEWRAEILAVVPENAGPEETLRLRARATDADGNTQPDQATPNPAGYGNNSIHEVRFHAR